ncbi:hypothetical protein HDU97_002000 [Phlyctochytrium planicorne]|nr:hypothetical protein HDU97_002000 [Phlyctochytrium planicorne]
MPHVTMAQPPKCTQPAPKRQKSRKTKIKCPDSQANYTVEPVITQVKDEDAVPQHAPRTPVTSVKCEGTTLTIKPRRKKSRKVVSYIAPSVIQIAKKQQQQQQQQMIAPGAEATASDGRMGSDAHDGEEDMTSVMIEELLMPFPQSRHEWLFFDDRVSGPIKRGLCTSGLLNLQDAVGLEDDDIDDGLLLNADGERHVDIKSADYFRDFPATKPHNGQSKRDIFLDLFNVDVFESIGHDPEPLVKPIVFPTRELPRYECMDTFGRKPHEGKQHSHSKRLKQSGGDGNGSGNGQKRRRGETLFVQNAQNAPPAMVHLPIFHTEQPHTQYPAGYRSRQYNSQQNAQAHQQLPQQTSLQQQQQQQHSQHYNQHHHHHQMYANLQLQSQYPHVPSQNPTMGHSPIQHQQHQQHQHQQQPQPQRHPNPQDSQQLGMASLPHMNGMHAFNGNGAFRNHAVRPAERFLQQSQLPQPQSSQTPFENADYGAQIQRMARALSQPSLVASNGFMG